MKEKIINFCKLLGSFFLFLYSSYIVKFFFSLFNVIENTISIDYIVNLLRYAVLIPFSCVSVYILGVERLFRKNGVKILMGGLIWAIVESFNYAPELLNIFFNVLPTFILGVFLSYIYSRNKNIWFPIVIYGLYLLFSPLLIGYLGW